MSTSCVNTPSTSVHFDLQAARNNIVRVSDNKVGEKRKPGQLSVCDSAKYDFECICAQAKEICLCIPTVSPDDHRLRIVAGAIE